jgi:hypothetical protein
MIDIEDITSETERPRLQKHMTQQELEAKVIIESPVGRLDTCLV